MRVVFDYQIFTEQAFGGISRYFVSLATELNNLNLKARIVAPLHTNRHLRASRSDVRIGQYVPQIRYSGGASRWIDLRVFDTITRVVRPDVIHETYYSIAPTYTGNASVVVTVFDMIHERFPDACSPRDMTAQRKAAALRRADRIICISESTRRDLLSFHPIDENRIKVVHLGYDRLDPLGFASSQIVGDRPYLLHVGARNAYKNFISLAQAVATSPSLKELRIVCVGGGRIAESERVLYSAMGLRAEDIIHVPSVSDQTLASLYVGARALAYPSLYEGFGIPVLEAMSLGCPVVCCSSSSLPEVAGDAAEFFTAGDIGSLCSSLEKVVESGPRRAELIRRGHERADIFSWNRCARETLEVYRSTSPES